MKMPSLKLKNKSSPESFSVGLNIGSSTIKLVKLKFIKDEPQLCSFRIEPIGADLPGVLKKIAQSEAVTRANASISGAATVIRYVCFPRMQAQELKGALKFEAEKHIPFNLSEVSLDSYVLKEDLPDNKMLVLLAAAKKEMLDSLVKTFISAGIGLDLIDIDSIALINAFNFNYSGEGALKDKTVALLNIGALVSNLNILEDGIPFLSRDIQLGGNTITQKIADSLGLDFKAAEEAKLKSDHAQLQKIMSAVDSVFSNFTREIRTSFDYYESQHTASVVKIFVSGGASIFPGLKDTLANLLGIEVEYWDPFKRIKIADGLDTQKIRPLSSQLAAAVGLALRK